MTKKNFLSFQFCIVTWLVMIGFALSTIGNADAQQTKRSACEGWWSYAGDESEPTLWMVLISATKKPGVFQIEGTNIIKKTREYVTRIAGTYKEKENEFLGTIRFLNLSNVPDVLIRGEMSILPDGTPCFVLTYTLPVVDLTRSVELIKVPGEDFSESSSPVAPVGSLELEITSLTVEPAEVESGAEVTLKYEFMARDIPDTALSVSDGVTVTGPIPSPAKGQTKSIKLSHFQHRPNGLDGGGSVAYRMTPTEQGSYTCTLELTANGYPNTVKRDVTFTVKPKANQPTAPGTTAGTATGAANIPPGTQVWVLKNIDIDPNKIVEKDANLPERERHFWKVSPNSASGVFQAPIGNDNSDTGRWMRGSVTFGGAVPSILKAGDTFDMTMIAAAAPENHISGAVAIGGRVDAPDLTVSRTPPDVPEAAGAFQMFISSQQITYHIKVPQDLSSWGKEEFYIQRVLSGQGALAVCHYVKKITPVAQAAGLSGETQTQPNPEESKPLTLVNVGNTGSNGETQAQLSVRLKSPALVLAAGESSWPDDVGISGWRVNTADRVEIDIPVQDNWGSLKINRNLVVAPGPTSMPPSEMTGPEDWFSELWSARIGARSGVYVVPVIVRQVGAGEAAAMLTIYVIPKALSGYLMPTTGSGVGNFPGGRPVVTGNLPSGRPAVPGGTNATSGAQPSVPSVIIPTDRPVNDVSGTVSSIQDTVAGAIGGSKDTVSGTVHSSQDTVAGALENDVSEPDRMAALEHQEAGTRFYDDARWGEAEHEFRAGVKLDPEATDMWEQLASACAEQKKWDEGIAAIRQAMRLNPQEPSYRLELSSMLQHIGREAEAKQEQKEGERLQKEMY